MDRLQLIIAVSDVILNRYGKNPKRKKRLTAKYGTKGAQEIQDEVNVCLSNKAEYKYLAVASIAGHYGAGKTRRKALGLKWQKTQDRIDYIWSMRGRSINSVAKLVIGGMFDKDSARELLLTFCGYNPEAVQAAVNYILNTKSNAKFCVYPVWFFEGNESLYGDCTAVLEYADDGSVKHCILIDTAQASVSATVIKKLKAAGVKNIDAIIISHAHGDHYGGLSNLLKAFSVGRLYLPDCTELDKYQRSYGNAIRRQAKKINNHVYLKAGSAFVVGDIRCECIFQAPAKSLSEHDSHHFVNNESVVLRFDLGGVIYHTAGDLQNEGNNLLIKAVSSLNADIYKCQWHGDANATNDAICKAVRPKYAFSNYHHKPSMSGRGTTRKRLQAVGAKFYDNYTYGDIFFYISNGNVSVKTSKKG